MKECLVDGERAVVAHDQAPKVPQPADRALDDPTPLIPPQGAPILGRRSGSVLVVGRDQGNSSSSQPLSQRVAVGSLDAMLPRDRRTQRVRIPGGEAFLDEMTRSRGGPARNIFKKKPQLSAK